MVGTDQVCKYLFVYGEVYMNFLVQRMKDEDMLFNMEVRLAG